MNSVIGNKPKLEGWEYIISMVNTVRDPSLILDDKNQILFANRSFRNAFQIESISIENKNVFDVGHKQLNIPKLKKLLKEIIPKNGFFNDLKIHHHFPYIGEKIFLVSARRVNEIVFLTMEDVTISMTVAKTLADFAKIQVDKIVNLERDIQFLKGSKKSQKIVL